MMHDRRIISFSAATSYDKPNLKDEITQGMLIDFF